MSNTGTITTQHVESLKAARITLDYIQSRISARTFINPENAPHLTLCVLQLDNGFCAVGKSAPASPSNFNKELGEKYAYDNAIKELWQNFGFTLCEVLHTTKERSLPLQGIR